MHLNAPRSAYPCKDTCSSKQEAKPPECFAAAIASVCTASAWHHEVYSCREAYKESYARPFVQTLSCAFVQTLCCAYCIAWIVRFLGQQGCGQST